MRSRALGKLKHALPEKIRYRVRRVRRRAIVAWLLFSSVEVGRVDLGETRTLGRQLV